MGATATRMTAEEYYATTVEGDRTQLVEGELVVNEPKLIHGELQFRLVAALRSWTAAGDGRGQAFLPSDVRVDERNVYGPDAIWFAAGHVPAELDAYPERIPDLCVEIRRSTPRSETFDVAMELGSSDALTSPQLPGFSLPLEGLFAR